MAEMKSFMNSDATIEDLVMEQWAWKNKPRNEKILIARRIARRIARIDRSNPFAYNVVMSHLMSGVYTPEDYAKRK